MKTIYLRNEYKKGERRSPLTPGGVKKLTAAGVTVYVETSTTRIFDDQSYQNAGAQITSTVWQDMPVDTLILGLKELALSDDAIAHDHIYFAHAFKGQDEAAQILTRFNSGGGNIFDIEFLCDENDRRVAAFGYWAGFVGAGLGLLGFAHYQKTAQAFPAINAFADQNSFVAAIKSQLENKLSAINVMVMGSRGRCGSGAVDLLNAVGIRKQALWDKTRYDNSEKPITEILEQDVFINTVYLKEKIPAMIDRELLRDNHKLRIISDVSCDPNSTNNPLPVYDAITHMKQPFVQAKYSEQHPVYVQAIDHLPTLLPKESSEEFAGALLPHLLQLCSEPVLSNVWQKALNIHQRVAKQVLSEIA